MKRREIWWVDFEPSVGSEPNKLRPAVIVSNDVANGVASRLQRGVVTVVPVTSNIETVHGFQVLLPGELTGLPRTSKAQAEMVRAVAIERFRSRAGMVPPGLMTAIDDALRLHLDL